MGKTNKRDAENRAIVLKTARIVGVTPRSVERVIKGEQNNEKVMEVYMELLETGKETENKLKMAVAELVPIPNTKSKSR